MNNFYIYSILDPRKPGNFTYNEYSFNYEPIYIGKGTNKCRMKEHLMPSQLKRDHNKLKVNKIKKIIKEGNYPILHIIIDNLSSEENALLIERNIVLLIGRIDIGTGPLTNLTNGGEHIHPKFADLNIETQNKLRQLRSDNMKKNNPMKNPVIAEKVHSKKRGKKLSADRKQQISTSVKNSIKHKQSVSSIKNKEIHRKIQEKNMIKVAQFDHDNNLLNIFPSIKEASRQLQIRSSCISNVINNKQKTTKNFIFKKWN